MSESHKAYALPLYEISSLGDGYAHKAVHVLYAYLLECPGQDIHACDLFGEMGR